MMQQLRQILEWAIIKAPTCKLFSNIRYAYYSGLLNHHGKPFWSASGFRMEMPENIIIGDNCSFGENTLLAAAGNGKPNHYSNSYILIGDNVELHKNVTVLTGGHYWENVDSTHAISRSVTIDNNAVILSNSIILPGVHIGKNALIGAGSVVTHDIPLNTIAVGNPCRPMKKRVEKFNGASYIRYCVHQGKGTFCRDSCDYYYDKNGCRTRWNIPKHGMAEA